MLVALQLLVPSIHWIELENLLVSYCNKSLNQKKKQKTMAANVSTYTGNFNWLVICGKRNEINLSTQVLRIIKKNQLEGFTLKDEIFIRIKH